MSDTLSGTTHPDDNDDHPWWGLPCTVTPCFGARLVQEGNRLHYLADRAGSGYLLRTDAWSYPVLRLKRLGLSKTFRRLVITLTRRYGVSLIHLDASAECLPGLPTFNW
ncbi:TPA: type IV toxin-antitoxin system YeeU family antitoxin [Escherichia coli]|nr:type IV toxin-antitoxin system YeeU family antitoxin [Escherichia coli]HBE6531478.1 type IV toxin-antitoxin system YeeU family antitoxin [Escherichia coli]